MTRFIAYMMTKEEATEILQNILDDSGIRLRRASDFYEASSDIQFLDGGQVDERLAQGLEINGECKHFAAEGNIVVLSKEIV